MMRFFARANCVLVTAMLMGVLIPAEGVSAQVTEDTAARVAIPPSVHEALMARFPNAVIHKQTKEREDGRDVFDIEFIQDGKKFEVDIFEDGTIHNWERAIAAKDLPDAVTTALERKYPGATLKEIMAVTEVRGEIEELAAYEVLFATAENAKREVTIAPDGRILEDDRAE